MVKIVVSDEVRAQLGDTTDVVELCDPSGRTLGHFVPATDTDGRAAEDGCPYSVDELARMRAETGGRPLAEIWQSLGRS